MLWGRSGNMCAFPECRKALVVDETLTDDPSIIGEEAHIVAQNNNGPRGKSELTLDQRNKYDNLILLCSIHHKIIDDQEIEFSVEKLHKIKDNHEDWIKTNLNIDARKILDDELYATYIERFVQLTDLHNWNIWTSWILGASQLFPKDQFESLQKLPDYIVSRIWPHRYNTLESSLLNFKNIVNDLMRIYHLFLKKRSDGYTIEKFYKEYNFNRCEDYDPQEESRAVDLYNFHMTLIEDLVLELTRAANYVCDQIRTYIFEGFRIYQGVLLVTRGDFMSSRTYRVEYRGSERTEYPYPGLKEFMEQRSNRDLHIGEGIDEYYFRKMHWE